LQTGRNDFSIGYLSIEAMRPERSQQHLGYNPRWYGKKEINDSRSSPLQKKPIGTVFTLCSSEFGGGGDNSGRFVPGTCHPRPGLLLRGQPALKDLLFL